MQDSLISLSLYPKKALGTIYWFSATLLKEQTDVAQLSTIFAIDYDLWHRWMGHPSKDVLSQARCHIKNFPKDLASPPSDVPICRGCAEGKMHLQPFEDSTSRASRPFELIHSDLKELPVLSYHHFKFFVTFLDDYTSHSWIVLLKKKSDMARAIDDFLAMIHTQYTCIVKTFMTDAGGEYKSLDLSCKLKELGILSRTSVPHMHQQNGRAERLNKTLIEKA